jgi:hypothetical protein
VGWHREDGPSATVTLVTRPTTVRATFAVTAAIVVVGLVIQTQVVVTADEAFFDGTAARLFNMFCFFTVQSNVIVGITCGLLAWRLDLGDTSPLFRMFRLVGVIDIAITGLVYNIALADLTELDGKAAVADQLVHVVVPIVAVAGWVVFGPRGLINWRDIGWAALVPLAWLGFTLIRGPIVDWYPYPFLDVRDHGYPRVLVSCALVGLLFLALAAGARALDRALDRRVSGTQ